MKQLRCVVLMGCVLLTACGPSEGKLSTLGHAQAVDENAPVKASANMIISAPVKRVWALLVAIPNWPHWQPEVSSATLDGSFEEGTSFTWTTGDNKIQSRIVLVKPEKAVAWTGHASVAKAVHVLTLTAMEPDKTMVESKESMDGFMLSWFYSSADLKTSEETLLKNLKVAAESNPRSGLESVAH